MILKELDVKIRAGFFWLRLRTSGMPLWTEYWHSGFQKRHTSRVVEWPSDSWDV